MHRIRGFSYPTEGRIELLHPCFLLDHLPGVLTLTSCRLLTTAEEVGKEPVHSIDYCF